MSDISITLGNKNYSSWSLRAWLPLKQTGVAFQETVIPLRRDETREALSAASPSGKVPVLHDGALTVWDSLAIAEHLAERFPEAKLWPEDLEARAVARAVTAEMHAGFPELRKNLPMDLRARHTVELSPGVKQDIDRIAAIWRMCRTRFESEGNFLFGGFTIADAAFAPVVSRFVTYQVPLDEVSAAYRDAVLAWPAMAEWSAAARTEPWDIRFPELETRAGR